MVVWRTDDRAVRVQVGSATAPGHRRDVNQDTEIVAAGVFGVADGVGGTGGGEVASGIAAAEVVLAVAVGQDGTKAAEAAHHAVEKQRASEPRLQHMGTTLCIGLAGWHDDTAAVQLTNVGDSRAYLLTPASQWRQVTRDQSYVQDLVDRGVISAKEAATHPRRNIITSSVGHPAFRPESEVIDAEPNMRLVFCSDGVTDVIGNDGLGRLVGDRVHPQLIADRTIDDVRAAAGHDDATVVVVDVVAVPRRLSRLH